MIKCGKCGERHGSAAAVAACYVGALFACHWMVERPGRWVAYVDDETGEEVGDYIEGGIEDCGAEAIASERGWSCAAGHEHVNVQSRVAEGWDYAEEYGEARDLAFAGVEPRTMSGHAVLGPQSFAP